MRDWGVVLKNTQGISGKSGAPELGCAPAGATDRAPLASPFATPPAVDSLRFEANFQWVVAHSTGGGKSA